MFRVFLSKCGFWPRKEHRYFTLKYTLKAELPPSQTKHQNEHAGNTLPSEQLRELQHQAILFTGSNALTKFAMFACDNESYVHTHLLETEEYKCGLVDSYAIEQIELKLKSAEKELAPKYLRS